MRCKRVAALGGGQLAAAGTGLEHVFGGEDLLALGAEQPPGEGLNFEDGAVEVGVPRGGGPSPLQGVGDDTPERPRLQPTRRTFDPGGRVLTDLLDNGLGYGKFVHGGYAPSQVTQPEVSRRATGMEKQNSAHRPYSDRASIRPLCSWRMRHAE